MFDIKYEPLHQILLSQPHAQIHHSNLYVIQSKKRIKSRMNLKQLSNHGENKHVYKNY